MKGINIEKMIAYLPIICFLFLLLSEPFSYPIIFTIIISIIILELLFRGIFSLQNIRVIRRKGFVEKAFDYSKEVNDLEQVSYYINKGINYLKVSSNNIQYLFIFQPEENTLIAYSSMNSNMCSPRRKEKITIKEKISEDDVRHIVQELLIG